MLGVLSGRKLLGFRRDELVAGSIIGAVLFVGIALQTLGLRHVNSSESGFITALYVPLVPLLQVAFFRKFPPIGAWVGTGISLLGLVLLTSRNGLSFSLGTGEWMTFLSSIAFAFQILLISKFAPELDALRFTFVQLLVVSALSLMALPLVAESSPHWSATLVKILLFLGIIATGLAILAMNWAQRSVPATRATLIYAMEPMWAGILGGLVGETFTRLALAGAALIVVGMLTAEFGSKKEVEIDDELKLTPGSDALPSIQPHFPDPDASICQDMS